MYKRQAFEYAKEAVHLEIEEYILKPVNSMELKRVFAHLKEKLDQEISEKRNAEILQKYYLDSLPLLQANFYSTLIEGRIHEDELPKFLEDYQPVSYTHLLPHVVPAIPERMMLRKMMPQKMRQRMTLQKTMQLPEMWQTRTNRWYGSTVSLPTAPPENWKMCIRDRICGEHLVPLGKTHILEQTDMGDSRIIDQHIQMAAARPDFGKKIRDERFVSHISDEGKTGNGE